MKIPTFVLTESEIDQFQKDNIKKFQANSDSGLIEYFDLPEKYAIKFLENLDYSFSLLEDDQSARSFAMRSVSMLFTLIQKAETISDCASIVSAINSLYPLYPSYADSLLSAVRSKIR